MRYEDGDAENILMAASRVRLEISAGEVLPPPSERDLSTTVEHLLREAEQKSGEECLLPGCEFAAIICMAYVRSLS